MEGGSWGLASAHCPGHGIHPANRVNIVSGPGHSPLAIFLPELILSI